MTHDAPLSPGLLRILVLVGAIAVPAIASAALTPGESDAWVKVKAETTVRIDPSAPTDFHQDLGDDFVQGAGYVGAALAANSNRLGPLADSFAAAWAAPGLAGALAGSKALASQNGNQSLSSSGNSVSEGGASWWDSLLITSPTAPNGSSGLLKAHLQVTGQLSAVSGAASFYSPSFASFSVSGDGLTPVAGFGADAQCLSLAAYCTYVSAGGYKNWTDGVREFGSTTIAVEIPFVFGEEFYIGFTVSARSLAQSYSFPYPDGVVAQAEAVSSFGSTVGWGGIDAIYRGGTPVGIYELASASGTDFRLAVSAPVPEVPPSLMLLAGLAILGALRRRTGAR